MLRLERWDSLARFSLKLQAEISVEGSAGLASGVPLGWLPGDEEGVAGSGMLSLLPAREAVLGINSLRCFLKVTPVRTFVFTSPPTLPISECWADQGFLHQ